jgi:hypothetical protein
LADEIYIFDEIVVEASQSAQLAAHYMRDYAPDARSRGMSLRAAWRSPAVEIPGRNVTLHFLWSVAGVGAWWQMRLGASRANPDLDVEVEGDDAKLLWWRWVDSIAVSRNRTFMVDVPGVKLDV